jgi:cell wall-associated NlpC family hydrolase
MGRRTALIGTTLACAAGAGGWLALAAAGEEPTRPVAASATATTPPQAETELPPLPADRTPTVVEPVAGASAPQSEPAAPAAQAPPLDAPAPTRQASGDLEVPRPSTAGDGLRNATALPNGIALPPLEAPEAVREMIEAGNVIARSPYLWGGGHGRWVDKGYDCSGSVSFVLAAAALLKAPLASGPLMNWGAPGRGRWVTIYSHPGHVFMVVAGIRFDTSGRARTGSRWQNELRSTSGFVARHPPGL